ncbi:MAG: D,D-dipeptide ABC transporter permease [Chloroflexi bacterium]|nr:D,D-dipeptide ABC transporter permease [Chloroflexota bacterium]MDL1943242.1 ABC transporter permease [Chloroflexi bacterium CFX2]
MTIAATSTRSTDSTRTARHVLSVILRDPLSLTGTFIIILVLFMAVFAEQAAPYPEEGKGKTNAPNTLMAPSADHWFGTDKLGRDILSRIIMGARSALIVPIGVVLFAVLLGAPLGALAGYKGGWLDEVIMRITDLFLAFPSLLLAMAIASALGRGLDKAAIALVVSWWPWYTRIARGVAVGLRERYFVEAAQAIGVSDAVIIFRHILPNTISPILVQATVDMGTVILAMGGLAFLGLGTQPPAPDWGLMVSEGRTYILEQWWIATFPGMAIFIVVLAFNLLGDTLRDIFDPRQYK